MFEDHVDDVRNDHLGVHHLGIHLEDCRGVLQYQSWQFPHRTAVDATCLKAPLQVLAPQSSSRQGISAGGEVRVEVEMEAAIERVMALSRVGAPLGQVCCLEIYLVRFIVLCLPKLREANRFDCLQT